MMFSELDRKADGDHGRRGVVEVVNGGWSGGERVGGGRGRGERAGGMMMAWLGEEVSVRLRHVPTLMKKRYAPTALAHILSALNAVLSSVCE